MNSNDNKTVFKPAIKGIIKSPNFIVVIRILISLTIVFSIHCKTEIITDVYPYDSLLGCILMRFSLSFFSVSFSDVLSFIAVYLILKHLYTTRVPHCVLYAIISVVFAVLYILGISFRDYNGLSFISDSKYQLLYVSYLVIGISLLIYNAMRLISHYILSELPYNSSYELNSSRNDFKIIWKRICILMIICWVPWLLCDYPGALCVDTIDQVKQIFGYIELNAASPPFSTFIIGTCIYLGRLIWNVNFGLFLYLLLQTVVSAVSYSYTLAKVRQLGCSDNIIKIFTLFFCLYPVWGSYMQWFEKDPLFSAILTLFTVSLIDIIKTRECTKYDSIKLFVFGLLAALLRHNGYYTVIPTLLIFAFYLRKNARRNIIIVLITVFAFFKILATAIYPALGFSSVSSQSYLCMPFQMTARYIVAYGDSVTEEEREAIAGVLDYDKIADAYNPLLSDPVNGLYTENDSAIPAYIKTWVKMGLKHPNIYFSAFINNNYGYLSPVYSQIGMYFNYGESEWESSFGIHHIFKEFPTKIFDCLREGSEKWPIFRYFSMAGTYTWLIIVLLTILIQNKKYKSILLFIPSLLTIAFCLVSPCTSELRYMMPNMAMVPMLIGWCIVSTHETPN